MGLSLLVVKKLGILTGIIGTLTVLIFTPISLGDFHAAMSSPVEYFQDSETYYNETQNVTFSESQVETLNDNNDRSLGMNVVADERIYCFIIDELGNVEQIVLADSIEHSDMYSVSGGCSTIQGEIPNGWLHTHPYFDEELSEADREVNDNTDFTCIQYAEMTEGLRGELHGVNCWYVDRGGADDEFVQLPVYVD